MTNFEINLYLFQYLSNSNFLIFTIINLNSYVKVDKSEIVICETMET